MKNTTKLIILSLTFTLFSCGEKKKNSPEKSVAEKQQAAKNPDSVSKEYITILGEISTSLTKVTDLESAKSTIPELKEIGTKMNIVKTDMENLGIKDEAMVAKLLKDHGEKMKSIMTSIYQSMGNLQKSNPQAYDLIERVLEPVMQK